MENITFVSVLGNSRFYDDTNYIFNENQREVFRLNHWYASHALLTYLKEEKSQVPNRILVLYPNTPEGVKSFEIGWESDYAEEGLGRSRKAIKDLFKENFSDTSEIIGIEFPNIENKNEIWSFLNLLVQAFNKIENSSVIVDITHGFRLFQSLLFSFIYYFENISSNKLEKIYYAIFQGKDKDSNFIELDQLIMLQQEISQIKLIVKNLDVSAFEWIKGNVKALKGFILTLQKVMLYVNNGIVSEELLEKIEFLLKPDPFKRVPLEVFKEYDNFYKDSFINGIIPEIQLIKEKIYGSGSKTLKVWNRQLNLAELLMTRKMDFSTALQLIRESFISWMCEEVMDSDPFDSEGRKSASACFGTLRQSLKSGEHGIKGSQLFSIISELSDERNNFAHVFTTRNKIAVMEKRSKSLMQFKSKILEDVVKLVELYKKAENARYFQEIVQKIKPSKKP